MVNLLTQQRLDEAKQAYLMAKQKHHPFYNAETNNGISI